MVEAVLVGAVLVQGFVLTCIRWKISCRVKTGNKTKLEALRERRPPWPRQIITLIYCPL